MSGQLIVLIGLPGSGKTEYVKRAIATAEFVGRKMYRVNWDELRKFFGHAGAFNHKREEEMKKASIRHVEIAVVCGGYQDVIIDNTNLSDSTRNMWRGVAQRLKLEYVEHEIAVDVRTAVQRDAYRAGDAQVGRAVIERMALFAGKIDFQPGFDLGYKNIVLVDVDGTLADNTHRAGIVAPQNCITCDGTGRAPIVRERVLEHWQVAPKCISCYGTGLRKKNWYEFYKGVSGDAPKQAIIDLVATLRAKGYIVCKVPMAWAF